jgi:anaerobic selenocysteine-containing dehydrogenase
MDGYAVKIEGNPLHPLNRGRICPKGHAGLQVLYDPDRIAGPLKRAGNRGEGRWDPIGWAEAVELVATRLKGLRDEGRPEQLLALSGQTRGSVPELLERLCRAVGSPNFVTNEANGSGASALINALTTGVEEPLAYDLEQANCIISFGVAFLEAWWSPVRQARIYGTLHQGRRRRGRLIQVEPRLSMTAAKADQWVPIRPGTDAALALGIAHILIKEGLYDKNFVAERTFGFETWKDEDGNRQKGFKEIVLAEYAPTDVNRITGVPVPEIVRLARVLAEQKPTVAVAERGAVNHTGGLHARLAIHALNALLGSIDTPGGVVRSPSLPLSPWPGLPSDKVAREGLRQPRLDGAGTPLAPLARHAVWSLPERLEAAKPYPVDTALVYYTNPCFSSPNPDAFRQALARVGFIVSFSPFMDETTAQADLVLPDHTYLERWQDDPVEGVGAFSIFGIRQPGMPPQKDTRNTGDVIIGLAKAVGGPVAAAFPWPNYLSLLKARVKGLYQSQQGSIIDESVKDNLRSVLQLQGFWTQRYGTFDEFWDALVRAGGWWDSAYYYRDYPRVLRTASGTYEFFSTELKSRLESAAGEGGTGKLLSRFGIDAKDKLAFLPHYKEPVTVGDEKEYPLHLITYKLMSHAGGRGANQPWLQEAISVHIKEAWDGWVEINPETAHEMHIHDGEMVWVSSPAGRVKLKARLYPGMMPHVVAVPFEYGHTHYGRWAAGRGENINHLVPQLPPSLAGTMALGAVKVKVTKA